MIAICGAVAAGVAAAALALAPLGSAVRVPLRHPERANLRAAGWRRGLPAWEAVRGLVFLLAVVSVAVGGPPHLLVAAPVAPSVALRWRVGVRRRAAARGALAVLQTVNAAMRSGASLAEAVRIALEHADPLLREPFDAALREFTLNGALAPALRAAAESAWDRHVAYALETLAVVAAEQLPSSRAAAIVAGAADRMAFEQRLGEEIAARTAGVRAQIVLLALLVPALALYLFFTMPGLAATLQSPLGLFVLVPAALVFELAGIVASRAIVTSIG